MKSPLLHENECPMCHEWLGSKGVYKALFCLNKECGFSWDQLYREINIKYDNYRISYFYETKHLSYYMANNSTIIHRSFNDFEINFNNFNIEKLINEINLYEFYL